MSGENRGEASVSHRMRVSMRAKASEEKEDKKEETTLRPNCPLKANSESIATRVARRMWTLIINKRIEKERDTGVVDLSAASRLFSPFWTCIYHINHARLALPCVPPRGPPPSAPSSLHLRPTVLSLAALLHARWLNV